MNVTGDQTRAPDIAAPVTAEWVTDSGTFGRLETEWNRLLEDSEFDSLFLRHEWLRTWWEAFGQGADLRILVVRRQGRAIGIAPLMLQRGALRRMPVRMLRFMANGITPRSFFIVHRDAPQAMDLLLDGIISRSREWDVLLLQDVPEDAGGYTTLRERLASRRIASITETSRVSPYLAISGSYDDYFAKRSENTRSNVRRAIKKLSAQGQVTMKKVDGRDGLDAALETAFGISAKSWKQRLGTDMGATAGTRTFYTRFAQLGADKGWVTVWLLYLDEKPLAMQFHVRYRGRAYLLRTDFDQDYGKLSPGTALEASMLKDYFAAGVTEYDLCGMNYGYKMKLTDTVRTHDNVHIFNNHLYSRLLYTTKKHVMPAIRRAQARLRQWRAEAVTPPAARSQDNPGGAGRD